MEGGFSAYPQAEYMLILVDGGGSKAPRQIVLEQAQLLENIDEHRALFVCLYAKNIRK
jgi:hypothetical protein